MSHRIARRSLLLMLPLATGCRPHLYQWHGSPYSTPAAAPDLVLTDTSGQPFDFAQARGPAILIYFGYSDCPDVYPATAADAAWLMTEAGPLADHLTFVTVDPRRDTLEIIRRFLDAFDTRFIGLTGTEAEREATRPAYGGNAEVDPSSDPQAHLITHTARRSLVDTTGLLVTSNPVGAPRPELLADLPRVLEPIQ